MHVLLRYLRRTGYFPEVGRPADGQLLERFLAQREEAAFEELVRRHGPMVLGVCRRVLRNEHAAEDAFQATFLVLVQKASAVKPRDLVGHWLYGVAYRTAVRARALDAKRRDKETAMPRPADPPNGLWQDVLPLLDEELSGLPEKYRIPVVLCDLDGKSRKEAAGVLGWSEGTLSSRLARARALLERRLSRRGVTLSGAAPAALLAANEASACVPAPLLSATTKAAMLVAAGQVTAAACVSVHVGTLAEGVVRTMVYAKLKTMALLCGVAALGIGTGGVLYQTRAGTGDPNNTDPVQAQERPNVSKAEGSGGDKRPEAQTTKVRSNDSKHEIASQTQAPEQGLPSDVAKRFKEFEAESEAIQKKANSDVAKRFKEFEVEAEAIQKKSDAEIQALRDKLVADLQATLEAFTKAGKLDEAVAIRDRIQQLQAAMERAHNLLVNGSFEEGPETPNDGIHNLFMGTGSTAVKGWRVTHIGAGVIDSPRLMAAHGKRCFHLGYAPGETVPGGVSQTFKTKKGQKYRVTFWMAGSVLGPPAVKQLQISAAGKSAEFSFDTTGKNRLDIGWVKKSWEFTAEKDQTTLEFTSLTNTFDGAAIDDVVVVPVNE